MIQIAEYSVVKWNENGSVLLGVFDTFLGASDFYDEYKQCKQGRSCNGYLGVTVEIVRDDGAVMYRGKV